MHYYKKNIGDYHKKAGRLNMLQHGSYTLLMDACYDRERFPTLDEAIDWVWASTNEEIEATKFVLNKFFTLTDGVYVQDHIQEELDTYHKNAKTNKRIAIEREEKRKKKRKAKSDSENSDSTNRDKNSTNRENVDTNGEQIVNDASTVEHEPPPNHKPLTINQEPLTKDSKDLSTKADDDQLIDHGDHESLPKKKSNDAVDIFQYWVEVMRMDPGRTKPTPKRMKAVNERLKQGYSVFDIQTAIYNCSQDPWSMGHNDRNKPFNDLELICRTGEKLESYFTVAQAQVFNASSAQTYQNLKDWSPSDEQ